MREFVEPTEEEQQLAAHYVLHRPLHRPGITVKKALLYVAAYVLLSFLLGAVLLVALFELGVFSHLPHFIQTFQSQHKIWFHILFLLAVYAVTGLLCLKKAAIGCIKLYQHYAPEGVRRRCLCMPTCSEYAILVIQKYGLLVGLFKIRYRLFKRCRGTMFMIDSP